MFFSEVQHMACAQPPNGILGKEGERVKTQIFSKSADQGPQKYGGMRKKVHIHVQSVGTALGGATLGAVEAEWFGGVSPIGGGAIPCKDAAKGFVEKKAD